MSTTHKQVDAYAQLRDLILLIINALLVKSPIIGTKQLITVKYVLKHFNMILTRELVYVRLEILSCKVEDAFHAHIRISGTPEQIHALIVQILMFTALRIKDASVQTVRLMNTMVNAPPAIILITGTKLQECALLAQRLMNSI